MNDRDDALFEAELHRLTPAPPPQEFVDRLVAARPARSVAAPGTVAIWRATLRRGRIPRMGPTADSPHASWWWRLGWLTPAAAAVIVTWLVWQSREPDVGRQRPLTTAPANGELRADDVDIDHRLVAAYDAVALLPGGEPVRFHFTEWTDKVVMRDSARGVVVEQRAPRVEVVPVGYEIY